METRRSWPNGIPDLLAFALIVSALVFLFFGRTSAVAQARRLARVREHQAAVLPRVAADPRFKSIQLATATSSSGGFLLIQGTLPTEADLDALKALIASTQPPGPVDYRVRIAPK